VLLELADVDLRQVTSSQVRGTFHVTGRYAHEVSGL